MRKDIHFGSVNIIKGEKCDVLEVSDFINGQSLSVYDTEIKENPNSPEVVSITVYDTTEKMSEVFIHKRDLLQVASFLLNIHTKYANKENELDFAEYRNQYFKEG